ncbi:hypothetical protein BJY01DRAFT_216546 [Aspergillus pseudoustus]|uniref:Uncharacterized protein n=1 Tax=Aspergillus pseudoustus TaxID=1810923 RepID=A0ABR4JQV5_9EURO
MERVYVACRGGRCGEAGCNLRDVTDWVHFCCVSGGCCALRRVIRMMRSTKKNQVRDIWFFALCSAAFWMGEGFLTESAKNGAVLQVAILV